MKRLTTAAIGVACLVLGAGGAAFYTHAATGPAFYSVCETNVTDEDAYKKGLRAGSCARHRRRNRSGLPSFGCFGEASAPDARMG